MPGRTELHRYISHTVTGTLTTASTSVSNIVRGFRAATPKFPRRSGHALIYTPLCTSRHALCEENSEFYGLCTFTFHKFARMPRQTGAASQRTPCLRRHSIARTEAPSHRPGPVHNDAATGCRSCPCFLPVAVTFHEMTFEKKPRIVGTDVTGMFCLPAARAPLLPVALRGNAVTRLRIKSLAGLTVATTPRTRLSFSPAFLFFFTFITHLSRSLALCPILRFCTYVKGKKKCW